MNREKLIGKIQQLYASDVLKLIRNHFGSIANTSLDIPAMRYYNLTGNAIGKYSNGTKVWWIDGAFDIKVYKDALTLFMNHELVHIYRRNLVSNSYLKDL